MSNLLHLSRIFLTIFILVQVKAEEIVISLNEIETDVKDNNNYEIADKVLTLKKNNVEYKISGTCTECQIVIKKEINVQITISSIQIDNSNTGPFVIKKSAVVNLILEGESQITDNENSENESSTDTAIAGLFEGAGIKFKNSSTLTISGNGQLTVNGNTKNGIKGGAQSTLIINGGTLKINSVKNALACDNLLTINDGKITIISQSDGIKAEPDEDDNDSSGTITINGGEIKIESQSDAIQAAYKLIINGGTFDIKTYNGASATGFDEDTMSAKGLKCSTDEHENVENILTINGGTFKLDTRDDAIHSDYNITITGGSFEISTGDDGVHAEQYLILGKLNANNNLINMNIEKSYEGLEGANIYIYSGTYNIISSDDGINSAGDAEGCSNNGGGQNDGRNPGGQGGQNGPGGNRPMNLRNLQNMQSQCLIFHINIYGGEIYVNTGSDGFDANGDINISGGNIEIWGMAIGGDGDPIDHDGTLTITGGTILAGGSQGMEPIHESANTISQSFIYSTDSYNTNKQIQIKNGDDVIKTITIPKNINYLFYTSKDTTSNYKFSEGTTNFKSGAENRNSEARFIYCSINILFLLALIL